MTPQEYVEARLGAAAAVTIGDVTVDLASEVALPHDEDVDDLLRAHAQRVAVWRRLRARASKHLSKVRDDLREMESLKFIHYYKAHEAHEREEWARYFGDEVEDAEKDQFGRHQRAKARVAKGERSVSLRWRRNFSDDLVWAYVRSDDDVVGKKAELRRAQSQFELAEALCDAMDHRARCLSHLAAMHRDLGQSR